MKKKIFEGSDFFGLAYKKIKISYHDMEESYQNAKPEKLPHEDYLNGITLYKKTRSLSEVCSVERNIEAIFQMFRWLVNPELYKGMPIPKEKNIYLGMNAQKFLCDYIQESLYENPEGAHHKWMALIVEHKRIVNLAIEYLKKVKLISEECYIQYKKLYEEYEWILRKYTYLLVKNQNKKDYTSIFLETEKLISRMKRLGEFEERFYLEII